MVEARMQRFRSWLVPIAVAIALAAGVPQSARALTLADLDAGGTFSVGALTFSDFEVLVAGDLSADLSDYCVQLLGDGFRIAGPLSTLMDQDATLLVSYVVEATGSFGIEGASLFSPLVAVGPGAAALVSDSILDGDGNALAQLLALNVFGVGSTLSESASFAAQAKLQVVKVVALGGGVFSAAPHVDQRFFAVPEPITLAMLASGLVGLAVAGRRRAMVA
jgi:hypothetical protein